MKRFLENFATFVRNTSRSLKKAVFAFIDAVLSCVALYLAFCLHQSDFFPEQHLQDGFWLFFAAALSSVVVGYGLAINSIKLQMFESTATLRLGYAVTVLSGVLVAANAIVSPVIPSTVFVMFGLIYLLLTLSARIVLLAIVKWLYGLTTGRQRILIYGAGNTGVQLAAALRQSDEFALMGFIDDNRTLHRMMIAGAPVFRPTDLKSIVEQQKIERVFIALPASSQARQLRIAHRLKTLGVETQALPSFAEIIDGRKLIDALQAIHPDTLLSRAQFANDLPGTVRAYQSKTVLITGAGGSIGSEICRQIVTFNPTTIVLLDHSEYALYAIEMELKSAANCKDISIHSVLGSVVNETLLEAVFARFSPQVVIHAAAYKHVPMVEANSVEGIRNNVIGTSILAKMALRHEADNFILISTDKAVRPTSVMGASKRMAELVIQDLASQSRTTLFSMVRFGNVLGSSGSVIPLFKDQIERGGPVTLTHRDVTRYFMTIPEAVQLVLIAGSFSRGGDVFVLDMGEPVRIYELARKLIEMSGHKVKNAENPAGDIEIIETGLRSGEKLYEELLITSDMLSTPHEKILRAQETALPTAKLEKLVSELSLAIKQNDAAATRHILAQAVVGFSSQKHPQVIKLHDVKTADQSNL